MVVTSAPRSAATRVPSGFRPDVEGLRAVAIGLVLLFNAGVPLAGGGLVGVDVFFVISGFLITGLLVRERETTGRVSLREFYARRARRILPSAAAVLVVTVLATALLVPDRAPGVARDGVAGALQVANWWLLGFGVDSLGAEIAHSPLKHYWSLAVEEQFYLLCPLLVVLLGAVRRRLVVALVVLTASSLAASVVVTTQAELLGYLSTPTRAWQFGAGGLLALAVPALERAALERAATGALVSAGLRAGGIVGLFAVLGCLFWVPLVAYPGSAALVPTLGTVLIIAAGCAGRSGSGVGRLLSWAPVRFMGRLSYTWYLWHVPVVFFAVEVAGVQGWRGLLLVELLAAVPAAATMLLVEGPARRAAVFAGAGRGLLLGAGVTAGAVATCLAVLLRG